MLYHALRTARKTLAPNHVRTAGVLHALGLLHLARGDLDRATKGLAETILILEAHRADTGSDMALVLSDMAQVRSAQGRHREAIHWDGRVLHSFRALLGPRHPQSIRAIHLLGIAQLRVDPGAAEATLREALAEWERWQPSAHPTRAWISGDLAKARFAQGDREAALHWGDQALATASKRWRNGCEGRRPSDRSRGAPEADEPAERRAGMHCAGGPDPGKQTGNDGSRPPYGPYRDAEPAVVPLRRGRDPAGPLRRSRAARSVAGYPRTGRSPRRQDSRSVPHLPWSPANRIGSNHRQERGSG